MGSNDQGKNHLSLGPWGSADGFHWDDGVYSTIRQVVIMHGPGIDSLQVEYDRNGRWVWSEKHGGSTSRKTATVRLDYPEEYLTSLHGYYGNVMEWGPVYVRSLTLESSRRTYGPYGIEQGTYFSLPIRWGKIVGFHGRSSWYLNAIGVHLQPHHTSNPSRALLHAQTSVANFDRNEKVGYSVMQGSLNAPCDRVVPIKHKDSHHDDNMNPHAAANTARESPRDFVHAPAKEKSLCLSSVERMVSRDDGPVSYGPFGGDGGTGFDDGISNGVRQILLTRSVGVASIMVLYDRDGKAEWGSKNGGSGGFKVDKITFDYPNEVLMYITGFYGPTMLMGPTIIKSLTFHTSRSKYGPYGEERGTPFSTNLREGRIVGFHGRKGLFIHAIGVHANEGKVMTPKLSPSSSPPASSEPITHADKINTPLGIPTLPANQAPSRERFSKVVVKEPARCGPGPWGGEGGRPWDDGVFSGIRQIILVKGEAICSIQVEYDRNGQSVWSVINGGNGGISRNQIKLDYPHEVVTRICGYYGPINREGHPIVVRSLTLYTSRGKYGPFGEEVGIYFSSTTTEGKVVGFHGRSSMYLDAIGVHMQHWLGSQKPLKPLVRNFFI